MKHTSTIVYELMHMEKLVATISTVGKVNIHNDKFMPYDLFLECDECEDIDGANCLPLFQRCVK